MGLPAESPGPSKVSHPSLLLLALPARFSRRRLALGARGLAALAACCNGRRQHVLMTFTLGAASIPQGHRGDPEAVLD
jgi:hypothetical protein